MKIIKTIISIIIFANLISYSQEVPFGNVTRLRKISENSSWSSIVSYKTNIILIPYGSGTEVLEFSGETFAKSFISNFGIINFADTLNDIPFVFSDDRSLSFKIENQPWKKIFLIERINDYQIVKDKVYFIGYNQSELQRYLIRTSDFIIFERIKLSFFSDSDPRIFKINDNIYISSQDGLVYDIYKLNNFNSFTKVETKLNNIIDGIQFKNKFIYRSSNGNMIYSTDLLFSQSNQIGFQAVDDYNFIAGSDLIFILNYNKLYFSYDGNSWSSFSVANINSSRSFLNSIVFHDKHIFLAGDQYYVYKIGPIISSKGLSVESELIHAVKITGNIGQQVEISASDELNGEYKPLTYFTLPSTEFIYNDNRTNKAKQYYKIK